MRPENMLTWVIRPRSVDLRSFFSREKTLRSPRPSSSREAAASSACRSPSPPPAPAPAAMRRIFVLRSAYMILHCKEDQQSLLILGSHQSAVAADPNGHDVYIGTGIGELASFDMRTENCWDATLANAVEVSDRSLGIQSYL